MEQERIIDRFDQYMKAKGINDNRVTVNADLSVGLIGNARRGKHDLGKKATEKILSFYQDLNRTWLLTGEGRMINGPYERIKQILDKEGISEKEFARGAGTIEFLFPGIYKNAKNNPGNKNALNQWIDALLERYPKYSRDWILTGDGEMTAQPVKTFPLKTDHPVDIQEIPLYEFSATAGLIAIFNDALPEPTDHLRIPHLPPVDGAIYARGDSMTPLIESGDIIIFKRVELHPDNILWGHIYIISYSIDGDEYTVLKYIRHSSQTGHIRLESFNSRYDPQDIPTSSITALALVKASITFHTIG